VGAAAEVSVSVSSREVFVDVPFVLQISIDNTTDYEKPQLPQWPGVNVIGGPSENTSSFTHIIKGRVTKRQTVTLSYQLAATRSGTLTIGPITVVADGQTLQTAPIRVAATRSETGDLLFLEVVADRDTYYLGETIELTLEIWLKPFHDRQSNVRLNDNNMWQRIDGRSTGLGLFADYTPPVRVRTARRPGADGIDREYFVYMLRSRVTPQQAGALAFDDVRVVVRYPVELQRSRSFFDRGWQVARTRPAVAAVRRAPIQIETPPLADRPPSFTGAVGRFDFQVTAKPTEVVVGDPVTLTMTITDRTPGGARLEALQPPALDAVAGLGERFRIPADPLAGVVEERRKTFTQTIRAKDESVSRIPPIAFSYFDPEAQRYVRVQSDPIDISVEPAAEVTMTDVVGFETGMAAGPTELTEVSGGILANYSGPDLLVSQQVFAPTWAHGTAVMAPPLMVGLVAVGCRRARRLHNDHGYARRRSARRRALRRLREASQEGAPRQAEVTAQALGDYVADRCNLPAGALTSAEVVERLRQARMGSDLVTEVEALLGACEQLRYARAKTRETDGIIPRAIRCIDRLERGRLG
jgi:hypothetical protein